jgi:RNA-binding protein
LDRFFAIRVLDYNSTMSEPLSEDRDAALPPALSSAERRALRAKAHDLDPLVRIGDAGLSDAVLAETDRALTAHGLVKVRVFGDDRDARERIGATLVERLGCALVQSIGKLLVIWRRQPEPAEPARAPIRRRVAAVPKKLAALGKPAPKRRTRPGVPHIDPDAPPVRRKPIAPASFPVGPGSRTARGAFDGSARPRAARPAEGSGRITRSPAPLSGPVGRGTGAASKTSGAVNRSIGPAGRAPAGAPSRPAGGLSRPGGAPSRPAGASSRSAGAPARGAGASSRAAGGAARGTGAPPRPIGATPRGSATPSRGPGAPSRSGASRGPGAPLRGAASGSARGTGARTAGAPPARGATGTRAPSPARPPASGARRGPSTATPATGTGRPGPRTRGGRRGP